jgi:hypothetical protein
MKPVVFPECNQRLKAPMGVSNVEDMFTFANGSVVVSQWKPSLKERLSILIFGKVWLSVIGRTQPPVAIEGVKEFFVTEKSDNAN